MWRSVRLAVAVQLVGEVRVSPRRACSQVSVAQAIEHRVRPEEAQGNSSERTRMLTCACACKGASDAVLTTGSDQKGCSHKYLLYVYR